MPRELATRRLALGVFAVLLAVVVIVIGWRGGARASLERGEPEAESARAIETTALIALDDAERSRASSAASKVVAQAAAAPQTAALLDRASAIELVVLRRSDHQPVAGADVAYFAHPRDVAVEDDPQRWLITGVLEPRIAQAAIRATTDESGRVLVPRPAEAAIVAVSAPGLFADVALSSTTASPRRVLLVRDADVAVDVVDELGRPVAGARVALWREQYDEDLSTVRLTTTDAEGRALVRHAGYALNDAGEGRCWVGLADALCPLVERELDPDAVPTTPIRLVMPATGSIEVEIVDAAGDPYLAPVDVRVMLLTPQEVEDGLEAGDRRGALARDVRGGRVTFEHVALRAVAYASVQRQRSYVPSSASTSGPVRAGELVALRVQLDGESALLRGRALDADGSPFARCEVFAWTELPSQVAPSMWPGNVPWSDEDGTFEIDSPLDELPENPPFTLHIVAARAGQLLGIASIPCTRALTVGVHELGDLTMSPPPLVASGRVIDDEGLPVVGAEVSFEYPVLRDNGQVRWRTLPYFDGVRSTDGGAFVARGPIRVREVRLNATTPGRKSEVTTVALGSSDVELRLRSTARLEGRLLLPVGVRSAEVAIHAQRWNADGSGDSSKAGVDPDGGFALSGLEDGVYAISAVGAATGQTLRVVTDVAISARDPRADERLNPFDLRTIFVSTVHVHDASGRPVERGSARFLTEPGRDVQERGFEQSVRFVHAGEGCELLLMVEEHCFERVEVLAEQQTVRLTRAPSIRLAWVGDLPDPKQYALQIQLHCGTAENAMRWARLTASTEAVAAAPNFGEVRATVWVVGLGEHVSGWQPIQQAFKFDVRQDEGEQRFELAIEPAALAAAIALLQG